VPLKPRQERKRKTAVPKKNPCIHEHRHIVAKKEKKNYIAQPAKEKESPSIPCPLEGTKKKGEFFVPSWEKKKKKKEGGSAPLSICPRRIAASGGRKKKKVAEPGKTAVFHLSDGKKSRKAVESPSGRAGGGKKMKETFRFYERKKKKKPRSGFHLVG